MTRRKTRSRWTVLLAIGLAAGLGTTAEATYVHPTTGDPPTPADLVLVASHSKTIAVQILNLTPYQVDADSSGITAKGSTDKNRKTHKSFMFAPVGWPASIPPLSPGTWEIKDSTWAYTAESPNNTLHPYPFALSFEDQGGYVSSGSMGWTIRQVWNDAHLATKDVPLRLWVTRDKPKKQLKSEIFRVVSSAITELVDLLGCALHPGPVAWYDLFVATKELASSSFEAANAEETGGEKLYVAAYVVPESADSTTTPEIHTHSTSGDSTDGADVAWAVTTGHYSSQVMVTTQVLRGEDISGAGCCGTSPIVSITLWTPDQYLTATLTTVGSPVTRNAAGKRINNLLRHNKRKTFYQFCHLYNSLDAAQKSALQASVASLRARKPLTKEQGALLEVLAAALEKGKYSLKGDGSHARPSHK